jgi:hypothetical protein
MTDDVIDAKDFKIQNLERIIADKELEIQGLNRQLETVRYFVVLGNERVVKALRGEIEKPMLKIEEGDSI